MSGDGGRHGGARKNSSAVADAACGGAAFDPHCSVERALDLLCSGLRGTGFGRFFAWMQKTRREAARTTSLGSRCEGPVPLLPMHLPPTAVSQKPTSRRRRARQRPWQLATQWADLLVGLFAFWEVGSPTSASQYNLGAYQHSEGQLLAFQQLVRELVPFCRLTPSEAGVGRGQIALQRLLQNLEIGGLGTGDVVPPVPGTTAMPVKANRISLPSRVGHVDPGVWLPDRLRRYFLEPWRLQLPQKALASLMQPHLGVRRQRAGSSSATVLTRAYGSLSAPLPTSPGRPWSAAAIGIGLVPWGGQSANFDLDLSLGDGVPGAAVGVTPRSGARVGKTIGPHGACSAEPVTSASPLGVSALLGSRP